MYKHWRYRPADADRAYPFYAHSMRRFDEILRADKGGLPNQMVEQRQPADG
jgi:hypothetical protein